MKMLVVGGGPGGLYTALLTKRRHPSAEVLLVERNRADDTFGWGVVLSDQTVDGLKIADPESGETLAAALHHWDNIDVHFRGRVIRSFGHGFSGIGRRAMLALLQNRCRELGVELQFERETDDVQKLAESFGADIVIASDGSNSRIREQWSASYQPDIELRTNRFVWLGTPRQFDAFTFAFEETEHGWVQAHAYQFDKAMSTFIVEMPEHTWLAHGLDNMESAEAIAWCARVFEKQLQGQPLISNAAHKRGSAQWIRFPRITCANWIHWLEYEARRVPVVLLGDAAHTAHFSIGSGTKLALEDAVELDRTLATVSDVRDAQALGPALEGYQALRSVEVLKLQNAARNSTEWFEHVDRYATLEPEQLAYSMLTRSQRISHENLRLRDSEYIDEFESWFAERQQVAPENAAPGSVKGVPPMFTPYRIRDVSLPNRVVVSPMAQYSAYEDGTPSDWHLVHLGARATGGAGLVMTEMTCVAPDARITPWCPGLWNETQLAAWARIVRFVHEFTPAKIGLQLGHAGAKGATKKMWEDVDMPLESGGWPLIAPSETQYLAGISEIAREMTLADMIRVRNEFVLAAQFGERAGFDWLELHCAHGYLLSAFLSPLTNRRTDEYGGSMAARLRYPLEVFNAIREVWPAGKPISVRISAHDWFPDGNTADEAVEIARAFRDAGADMIDVSAGQVVKGEKPVFGRMWQTPFADRIRQEVGIPTMAVGAITDADQLNGILAAGRADLVAVARPHLVNPAWTLSEAARLGYHGAQWPSQYLSGKSQLERLLARERAEASATIKPAKPGRAHLTSLSGRHAVVTGANRGIGAAIAQSLALEGARVTLLVRDYAAGEAMRATLPGEAQVVQADITDEGAVGKACASAMSTFGPAHILVNNAGHAESAPFSRTDDAMLARMLAVHLYGPIYCVRALLPGMIAEKFGRIVNIASIAGVAGAPYISAYSAAKHAMVGFTRSLAKEVIARGITVNAVCPGYTETDLITTGIERIRERTGRSAADARASILANNPLQRMITPAEVASAVRWLCDDGAGSTTGQTVIIDGGELA